MKNFTAPHNPSMTARRSHILIAIWRWMLEPSPSIVEPERRQQAHLVMAILLLLLVFGLLGLGLSVLGVFSVPGESETMSSGYIWVTLVVVLLLAVEYGLSHTIHYQVAATLVVGTVLAATFVTTMLDPGNHQFPPFLVLGGLMGSLFFSARTTALIFLATFVSLLILPVFVPGISTVNNLNALFFILTVGGLVVMATILRQHYIEQIAQQTQQLVESEARLRELAIRDPLTGLFNRRYLQEALTLEIIRAARKKYQIGIIMADIDYFKQFNDTHGHASGDAALVQVARHLQTHVRSSDVTCRYGGEEFILILPEASQEITQMRAERICAGVRQLHLQYQGQTLKTITLSLGVAIFPEDGSTIDALLKAADIALYRAKRDGRDRVARAEKYVDNSF